MAGPLLLVLGISVSRTKRGPKLSDKGEEHSWANGSPGRVCLPPVREALLECSSFPDIRHTSGVNAVGFAGHSSNSSLRRRRSIESRDRELEDSTCAKFGPPSEECEFCHLVSEQASLPSEDRVFFIPRFYAAPLPLRCVMLRKLTLTFVEAHRDTRASYEAWSRSGLSRVIRGAGVPVISSFILKKNVNKKALV